MTDTADPTVTFGTVTDAGFPHGLMCMTCDRVLDVGDPFASRPIGFTSRAELYALTCVYCAETGAADVPTMEIVRREGWE